MSYDADNDKTPAERRAPLPPAIVDLLDLASSANSVAVSLQEAARQRDGAEGLARQSLCAGLADQLAEIGRGFIEAAEGLREEAGLRRAAEP